jgi:hypothetical protein
MINSSDKLFLYNKLSPPSKIQDTSLTIIFMIDCLHLISTLISTISRALAKSTVCIGLSDTVNVCIVFIFYSGADTVEPSIQITYLPNSIILSWNRYYFSIIIYYMFKVLFFESTAARYCYKYNRADEVFFAHNIIVYTCQENNICFFGFYSDYYILWFTYNIITNFTTVIINSLYRLYSLVINHLKGL